MDLSGPFTSYNKQQAVYLATNKKVTNILTHLHHSPSPWYRTYFEYCSCLICMFNSNSFFIQGIAITSQESNGLVFARKNEAKDTINYSIDFVIHNKNSNSSTTGHTVLAPNAATSMLCSDQTAPTFILLQLSSSQFIIIDTSKSGTANTLALQGILQQRIERCIF